MRHWLRTRKASRVAAIAGSATLVCACAQVLGLDEAKEGDFPRADVQGLQCAPKVKTELKWPAESMPDEEEIFYLATTIDYGVNPDGSVGGLNLDRQTTDDTTPSTRSCKPPLGAPQRVDAVGGVDNEVAQALVTIDDVDGLRDIVKYTETSLRRGETGYLVRIRKADARGIRRVGFAAISDVLGKDLVKKPDGSITHVRAEQCTVGTNEPCEVTPYVGEASETQLEIRFSSNSDLRFAGNLGLSDLDTSLMVALNTGYRSQPGSLARFVPLRIQVPSVTMKFTSATTMDFFIGGRVDARYFGKLVITFPIRQILPPDRNLADTLLSLCNLVTLNPPSPQRTEELAALLAKQDKFACARRDLAPLPTQDLCYSGKADSTNVTGCESLSVAARMKMVRVSLKPGLSKILLPEARQLVEDDPGCGIDSRCPEERAANPLPDAGVRDAGASLDGPLTVDAAQLPDASTDGN